MSKVIPVRLSYAPFSPSRLLVWASCRKERIRLRPVLVLSKIPGLSDPDFLICKNEATGLCLLKDLPAKSLGLGGQGIQMETYTVLRERWLLALLPLWLFVPGSILSRVLTSGWQDAPQSSNPYPSGQIIS